MSRRQRLPPSSPFSSFLPPLLQSLLGAEGQTSASLLWPEHAAVTHSQLPRVNSAWAVTPAEAAPLEQAASSSSQRVLEAKWLLAHLAKHHLWLLSSGLWSPATQWVLAGTCKSGRAILWVKQILLSGCEAYSIWSCKPGQKILELLLFQDDLLNGIVNVFITF